MPLNDMECNKCKKQKEILTLSVNEEINEKCNCGGEFKKIFPTKPAQFNLVYNPRTDIVDWNGNKTRFYDEYKKMKAEGKNPRIPALDGDG